MGDQVQVKIPQWYHLGHRSQFGETGMRKAAPTAWACIVLHMLLSAAATTAMATADITVRVLDAKTGKPLKGVSVSFLNWNEKGRVIVFANTVTDASGVAIVAVPDPVPDRIGVSYSPDQLWTAGDTIFLTAEILKSGIVARNKDFDFKSKYGISAKPGELVIFGRRLTLWERIRREL